MRNPPPDRPGREQRPQRRVHFVGKLRHTTTFLLTFPILSAIPSRRMEIIGGASLEGSALNFIGAVKSEDDLPW